MSQSLLLPAFIALFGVVAAMFLLGFAQLGHAQSRSAPTSTDEYWDDDIVDDDHYVEFTVLHDEPPGRRARDPGAYAARRDERHRAYWLDTIASPSGKIDTSRARVAVGHPLPPVEPWAIDANRAQPVRLPRRCAAAEPSVEPIGFAHNGFHVDEEQFQPLSRFEAREEAPPHETRKPDILSPDYPLDFGSHAHYESPDEPASSDRPARVDR